MILVFLVVLIMALIIANILISAMRPKKTEKGFANPAYESIDDPEVIDKEQFLQESTNMIKGNIIATNKKIELMNERLSTLEKVVMTLVEGKISEHNGKEELDE